MKKEDPVEALVYTFCECCFGGPCPTQAGLQFWLACSNVCGCAVIVQSWVSVGDLGLAPVPTHHRQFLAPTEAAAGLEVNGEGERGCGVREPRTAGGLSSSSHRQALQGIPGSNGLPSSWPAGDRVGPNELPGSVSPLPTPTGVFPGQLCIPAFSLPSPGNRQQEERSGARSSAPQHPPPPFPNGEASCLLTTDLPWIWLAMATAFQFPTEQEQPGEGGEQDLPSAPPGSPQAGRGPHPRSVLSSPDRLPPPTSHPKTGQGWVLLGLEQENTPRPAAPSTAAAFAGARLPREPAFC